MSDERRWWPITAPDDDEYPTIPHRSTDLVYAALGPIATHELLVALRASKASSPMIGRLIQGLEAVDGTLPDMLVLLAAAMGAVQREYNRPGPDAPSSLDGEDHPMSGAHLAETHKHLGSLVYEAMLAFGFTRETFSDYLQDQWSHLGHGEWPPAGAAYTQREPEGSLIVDGDGSGWEKASLDRFGRMSMIMSNFGIPYDALRDYAEKLDEAMSFASADVDQWYRRPDKDERDRVVAELESYVDEVKRLTGELWELGAKIDEVFPT